MKCHFCKIDSHFCKKHYVRKLKKAHFIEEFWAEHEKKIGTCANMYRKLEKD